MTGISHCLLVASGIIVVLEAGEKQDILNTEFELKTSHEGLFFQGAGISIPFTAKIIDHLLKTEEGNIYIYDGDDLLALNHMATVTVDKSLQLRAHGALWALAAQTDESGIEIKEPEQPDDVSANPKYVGLKLPPGLTKPQDNVEDQATATA